MVGGSVVHRWGERDTERWRREWKALGVLTWRSLTAPVWSSSSMATSEKAQQYPLLILSGWAMGREPGGRVTGEG